LIDTKQLQIYYKLLEFTEIYYKLLISLFSYAKLLIYLMLNIFEMSISPQLNVKANPGKLASPQIS